MPCQSIFARGPTKGRARPMTAADFWNLAGRAGRWGKEFQGNIVCVDARRADVWRSPAPTGRATWRIVRTSDEVLRQQTDALLAFVAEGTPRGEARRHPDLEHVFSYVVSDYLASGSFAEAAWMRRVPDEIAERVSAVVQQVADGLHTPPEVVLRHPGISPIAMDGLLDYFDNRTVRRKEPVEGLLPVLPESQDAVDEYAKVLGRVNTHLGSVFGTPRRTRQLALLVVDWMRGCPLARIIADREKYYGSDDLARLIRGTMEDVEEIARFQAPKFLSCYVDLLRVYLRRIERPDLEARLLELDMSILLEFGVSQQTQLSLMGLGLSRSSAIALSELIADPALDESGCLKWLSENDWMTADMPALIKSEIARLVEGQS